MSHTKNPLISLDARGTISKAISFVKRRGQHIAEKKPEVRDAKSAGQLAWRHMYLKCAALWHTLSAAEKQTWESLARPLHMTGFAYWQSQCLKPNPGIYLPLQGGTMSGNIDMAKNRILKLPLPLDSQEPLTLAYFTANIAPYLLTEGCRVYSDQNPALPNATSVTLTFNLQRYDTDSIHDTVTNNSRLTCKTPGKYIIVSQVNIWLSAVGDRALQILLNGTTIIALMDIAAAPSGYTRLSCQTIYHLALDDYVETLAYQDSGAVLTAGAFPNVASEFMMQRIGS